MKLFMRDQCGVVNTFRIIIKYLIAIGRLPLLRKHYCNGMTLMNCEVLDTSN